MRSGWIYEGKAEELTEIISEVKKLPITRVLSSYGVKFQRFTNNRNHALCPFHMDNRMGSFSVNVQTNSCWCFACNQGGDVIHSVMKILGTDYVETALQIACDNGIIDETNFNKFRGVKYEKKASDVSDMPIIKEPAEKEDKVKHMYNDVYEAFKAASGAMCLNRIKELKTKRHLTNERIGKDYFEMPSNVRDTLASMREKLDDKYTDEEIATVPGFFFEKSEKGDWKLAFLPYKGIGIILRDEKGMAVAIQIRLDDAPDGRRYIFMSGAYQGSSTMKGGASVGAPVDYLPSATPSTKYAIVEGRFKAEILSQKGFNTFSVQGVNNFKGLVPMIKRLGIESGKFFVFYDADLVKNPQVCAALIKLIEYVKGTVFNANTAVSDINVVIWDYIDGKGIDDLVFNDKMDMVTSITSDDFVKATKDTLVDAIAEAGYSKDTPASKLTKEDRDMILSCFEHLMRARLGLEPHHVSIPKEYFA